MWCKSGPFRNLKQLFSSQTQKQKPKEKHSFFYTADRFNLWKYGFILFSENLFFGKGPGGFAVAAYNDYYAQKTYGDLLITNHFTHNHPHNFVIQFLVEWGIIGTLLIFILLTILAIKSLGYFFKFKNHIIKGGKNAIPIYLHQIKIQLLLLHGLQRYSRHQWRQVLDGLHATYL